MILSTATRVCSLALSMLLLCTPPCVAGQAGSGRPSLGDADLDVLVIVYASILKRFTSAGRTDFVLFVSLYEDQDPEPEFLERLRTLGISVEAGSKSGMSPNFTVVDPVTGDPGMRIWARSVVRDVPGRAEVVAESYLGWNGLDRYSVALTLRENGWHVDSLKITGSS